MTHYDEDTQTAAIKDDNTGGLYVISREHVQVQGKGPRGGAKWLPL